MWALPVQEVSDIGMQHTPADIQAIQDQLQLHEKHVELLQQAADAGGGLLATRQRQQQLQQRIESLDGELASAAAAEQASAAAIRMAQRAREHAAEAAQGLAEVRLTGGSDTCVPVRVPGYMLAWAACTVAGLYRFA